MSKSIGELQARTQALRDIDELRSGLITKLCRFKLLLETTSVAVNELDALLKSLNFGAEPSEEDLAIIRRGLQTLGDQMSIV